jgi:choline-phosphate cytidylyltransferase
MSERTTVLTFGTFDLFHIGHLRLLERAAALGDRLIVGVSTDELTFSKKGRMPMIPQADRRAIVAALGCVDGAFFEESLELKRQYLLEHRADVLVMGDDWTGRFDEYGDICRVSYLARTENVSTTELEAYIRTREPGRRGAG